MLKINDKKNVKRKRAIKKARVRLLIIYKIDRKNEILYQVKKRKRAFLF